MIYADKNHSPYIEVDTFLVFLKKYAERYAGERPEWKKWTTDVPEKFWGELSHLVDDGKCRRVTDEAAVDDNPSGEVPPDSASLHDVSSHERPGRIFMVDFYSELLRQAYSSPDNSAEFPFPDEKSLGFSIPPEQIREIVVAEGLPAYLEDPQETALPVIKLIFEHAAPALALADLIPRQLM